jgi:PKD repeat protein
VPASGRPVAVATATPVSGPAPLNVAFSSAGSSDADGSITSFAWNFGNGGSSTAPNPSYTYGSNGTYTATLTVTDNTGLTGTTSVTVTVQSAPAAPANLVANPTCNADPNFAAISISWQDNSSNESHFRVEVSTDGAGWTFLANAATSPFTHASLPFATTRFYRVRAENAIGASDWSNSASTVTHSVPANAPTVLAASASSSTQVGLTWNMVANATGYRLERSTNQSTWTVIANPAAGTSSYNDSGLSGATTYFYRISAAGPCNYFTPASATVSTTTPPGAPAAPTNLSARTASSTQINLTWRDNATNETGYYVERSSDGATWTRIAALPAGTTAHSSTGLSAGTTYYYRVQAYNGAGASAFSNTTSGKTRR